MKTRTAFCFLVIIMLIAQHNHSFAGLASQILLPTPKLKGTVSVEETLSKRRSIRYYSEAELTFDEISQLLWAGQGITGSTGKRTAPSAGALYPLILYLVVGKVKGLPSGIYRYNPHKHALVRIKGGDFRIKLSAAALGQRWVADAPASVVFAVNYEKMSSYAQRGKMYANIEQGHAAQNILLQAVALGLGAIPIGAVRQDAAAEILDLPAALSAEYIICMGKAE
ncbi:MAG: SagB/ThcOx family dehydrogenase [Pseudomonadota bacterium]